MSLPIKGIQKTCLIDYPPYTASTIFLGGCNFRCSFCHNPDLVNSHEKISDISEQEILDYLESKKQWIDGVCITGGEPTLHSGLIDFASKIKQIGMLVKIDTNGTNPEMIKELIDKKLVDRFAMDIKAPLEKYDEVTQVPVIKENIIESIGLIKNSGLEYEFRTTVVPGLVEKEDIEKIGQLLKGSKKYSIQKFRGQKKLIDNRLQNIMPHSRQELQEMKKIAEKYFDEVELRE